MGSETTQETREPDFSGYVTKAGIVCTDGRMINADAFSHQDGETVPFVWQHGHKDVKNVLGHVKLEKRADGMYGYVYVNNTPEGQHAKETVSHGDLNSMSIWANELKEKIAAGIRHVMGGGIKEVSLALAGANSGAKIDNIRIAHSDNPDDPEDPKQIETLPDEAFIRMGQPLETEAPSAESEEGDQAAEETKEEEVVPEEGATSEDEAIEHASVQEVWDGMSDEEQSVVRYMIGVALEGADSAAHSEQENEGDLTHNQEGNQDMGTRNVFEDTATQGSGYTRNPGKPASLSHDGLDKRWGDKDVNELLFSAFKDKPSSMKEYIIAHAESHLGHDVDYGVENIDYLFPDAQTVNGAQPEFIKRRTDWVDLVLTGVRHSPFSRVKTYFADITADEARAKGYTKGNLKKEEWFSLSKRVTTPATIYKKQKLDRDDILDITDFDVVAWMKAEMRVMLDEEVARAILVGDGREVDDDDKIKEPPTSGDGAGIRPIAFDNDVYTHKVVVAANASSEDKVEALLRARKYYKGSGNPTFFTTDDTLSDFLLDKDRMGRRQYATEADVAAALRVKNIVTVEVMDGVQTDDGELVGLVVNLADYTVGADRGAAIALFDDFDIDYNQYKYLMETRISGSLTRYKAAIAVIRANGTEATPTVPSFDTSSGVLTVPSVTGVVYKDDETGDTLSAGAQTAIASGESVYVRAYADTGYYLPHNFDATWSYTRA